MSAELEIAVQDQPNSVARVSGNVVESPARRSITSRLIGSLAGNVWYVAVVGTIGTSFAIFVIHAVQGVVLARILGPEARGEFATAVFYTRTLTYVGLLGIAHSIARRAARKTNDREELSNSAIRTGGMTGLLTLVVVSLLSLLALPADKQYLAPISIACALMLPWEHMRLALLAVDHGSGLFRRYNLSQFVSAAAFPALILCAWVLNLDSVAEIAILCVPASVLALAFHLWHAKLKNIRRQSPAPFTLLREGRPFLLSDLVGNLVSRLDVFLFVWLASFTDQGYYAAALPAVGLLGLTPQALSLFAFNAGAKTDESISSHRFLAFGGGLMGFQVVVALAYAAVLEPLIVLVYGSEFHGATVLAYALLPGYACYGLATVADGYLRGRNRAIIGVWARILGAVALGGTVWLLYAHSVALSIAIGASVGHTTSALFMGIAVLASAKRNPNQQRTMLGT